MGTCYTIDENGHKGCFCCCCPPGDIANKLERFQNRRLRLQNQTIAQSHNNISHSNSYKQDRFVARI
jgi:hypothetical protein